MGIESFLVSEITKGFWKFHHDRLGSMQTTTQDPSAEQPPQSGATTCQTPAKAQD